MISLINSTLLLIPQRQNWTKSLFQRELIYNPIIITSVQVILNFSFAFTMTFINDFANALIGNDNCRWCGEEKVKEISPTVSEANRESLMSCSCTSLPSTCFISDHKKALFPPFIPTLFQLVALPPTGTWLECRIDRPNIGIGLDHFKKGRTIENVVFIA